LGRSRGLQEFKCFGSACQGKKTLKIDLINLTRGIAIEANGIQHSEYVQFFHGDRNGYLEQIERDGRKVTWCELNDLELIYIYPDDELSVKFFRERYDLIL